MLGLLVAICVTYSIMLPFVLIWAVVGFGILYVVMRYNLLYNYSQEYDSAGALWPGMFTIVLIALLISQLLAFALMLGFRFWAAPLILLLIPITLVFYFCTRRHFSRVWKNGALDQLANAAGKSKDLALAPLKEVHDVERADEPQRPETYLQPEQIPADQIQPESSSRGDADIWLLNHGFVEGLI